MTTDETTPEPRVERTAYWGTCIACHATVVVYPHLDRGTDLPDHEHWANGFPTDCPVCDDRLDREGTDPVEDVRL